MNGESEDYSFMVPEEKKVSIILGGRTFLISSLFSINDMIFYQEALKRGDSAKDALCDVLYRKLQKCDPPVPTLNEVRLQNDRVFELYIMAVINRSHDLQSIYAETDAALPILERFSIANRIYWEQYTKKLAQGIQPLLTLMEQINRSTDFSWLNSGIQQTLGQYQSMLNGAISPLTQFAQQVTELMAPIQNTIAQISNVFSNIIANIQIPTFTEERKQELQENYKTWGRLGWSVIPHAPMKLFNEAPLDEKQADKDALQYFNKTGMDEFFALMKETSIRKEELNSAIFCFKNKQYKACALLLFGIMDGKLIRLQPNKTRRKVGKGAVRALEAKFDEKADAEFFFYHILYYSGLVECLSVFFENGEDFREEPKVINRNFINHGMNRRRVRRKDCIQLFLALYNLAGLLEDL